MFRTIIDKIKTSNDLFHLIVSRGNKKFKIYIDNSDKSKSKRFIDTLKKNNRLYKVKFYGRHPDRKMLNRSLNKPLYLKEINNPLDNATNLVIYLERNSKKCKK